MDLFDAAMVLQQKPINILPRDGIAHYYGKIIRGEMVSVYFQSLLQQVQWNYDKVIMFGKQITTNRKTAWYGDKPFPYTYSKMTKIALPWFSELITLKALVEILLMKGSTQSHWLHALPSTKGVNRSRINLTFRRIIDNSL